jgi:hypothetical protein
MCKEVQVGVGAAATLCGTVGELRSALGVASVVVEGGARSPADDECLCNVDFETTAAMVGLAVRKAGMGEGFPYPELIISAARG